MFGSPANGGLANDNRQEAGAPTKAQKAWLLRGLRQPGGKLPLFDRNGQRVRAKTVQACLDAGWAEAWCSNPIKPDWQVCKLTAAGYDVLGVAAADRQSA